MTTENHYNETKQTETRWMSQAEFLAFAKNLEQPWTGKTNGDDTRRVKGSGPKATNEDRTDAGLLQQRTT